MDDFATRIATQEWWSGFGFWLLCAGLIGDVAVLAIPEEKRRLEKLLGAFFTAVIIAGCFFEHVADNRISDLVTQEELATGVEIGGLGMAAKAALTVAGNAKDTAKTATDSIADTERRVDAVNRSLDAAQKKLDKVAEYSFARALTRKQYNLLAGLKGKVKKVYLANQALCTDCSMFGMQIFLVLHESGVEVVPYTLPDQSMSMSGVVLWTRNRDFASDPLISAFRRADLFRSWGLTPDNLPQDAPIIFVGQRDILFPYRPALPPPKTAPKAGR